ncbi:hypothetical protein [Natronoglomus mannanivorans]|uniref:Uncharacterized protein n=1 Tax=Natronoglomus mannanivorans TaxID=2979990 RepID=A0AAP2YWM7_9EURY|nr:hypothetical protein [Halobacteria archaeon AArc-xg1-1]
MTPPDETTSRAPTRSFHGERSNAYLSWLAVAIALLVGGRGLLDGRFQEVLFAASVAAIALAPAIAVGSKRAALPWEIPIVAVLPLVGAVFAPDQFVRQLVLYTGAAVLALALTLELHALTEIRFERWLAGSFVAMLAATFGAIWSTLTWIHDLALGTSLIASNTEVMWLLVAATAAGSLAGTLFDRYYRQFPGEELVSAPVDGIDEEVFAAKADMDEYPSLEERLPLSADRQRQLVQLLRATLVAMVAYGVVTVDPGIVSNTGAMLLVTFVPTLLRRRYDLPFDAGLVLWITVVVFLHSLGSVYLYDQTFWWHNVTHPLSATLVGAIGYVVIRTLDELRDDIHLPLELTPWFVVLFVVSFGVFWEIGEFAMDALAATTGLQMPLSQHGLADTMTDLVFNTIGSILVAFWGLPYLTDLTDAVTDRLEGVPILTSER